MFKIKELFNLITGLWADTEAELSSLSKEDLIRLINNISNKVDRMVDIMNDFSVCSHCDGDRISICEMCLDKMEEEN
tara:strand:+ start:384 stop:614 length:231 start_codon:yes stop_codon:yes gene_type:complete